MPSSQMERAKEETKLPAPCVLWPVELKLTHIDCSPEETLIHFQGQYMTICELDYNILQVEIQNTVKSQVSVQVGEVCLVEDAASGRWHRGRVLNIQNNLFHVFLVDHGDVLIVEPSHLSSIPDTLLMLPPKIVCGFFANILPLQNRWDRLTGNYLSSLIGSQIKGYIHARLPYHVLILEVPDINRDFLKMRLGRHVDTSTFLLLVEILIGAPVLQNYESVPDLLIEKQKGQECCLKSSSLLGFEELLSLNGPKLKVGQKVRVVVSAAVNPGLFYCRLSSTDKDLQEMSEKLARACESDSGYPSNKPLENLGLLCAIKGKDGKWHRGFVQCLPLNSQVQVVFVDSGYSESVKVENIFQLPSELISTPIMAFPCSLSCWEEADETIKNQQLVALKTGLLGKSLEVTIDDFCKDQNFYLVTLSTAEKHSEEQAKVELLGNVFDSKSNFPHNFLSKEMYATETKAVQTSDSVSSQSIPDGAIFEGYVVHVQSPKHFWIRTKEQNPKFENMMKEMTDYFTKLQLKDEVFEDPVPGAHCCAMYENDMHYYRAIVVDTLENGAEVFFIDFGNTEKVPNILIKKLPPKFAIHPEFALKCALAHVAPFEDIWTTTASNFFRQVTSNKTLVIHNIHRRNAKYVVDLFERGAEDSYSIAKIMTAAKMALDWRYNPALASVEAEKACKDKGNALSKKKNRKDLCVVTFRKVTSSPNPNQWKTECEQQNDFERRTPNVMSQLKAVSAEAFKPKYFKPGTELTVSCSHVNSPSDFWCQDERTKVDLDKLMEEIQAFYQTHTVALETPAGCCAVKSPQDNRWHRACILGKKNEELLLILVDLGIILQERMQNIQALAPQFFELHEQAFRCSLDLIEPVGGSSWSSEACSLFKDFVSENSPCVCRVVSQLYEQGKGLLNVVTLHTPHQQATTYLSEKGVAMEMQSPKQLISSSYPRSFVYSSFNLSSGSEELVHVTQVCSPWEIYFQLDRNTEILDALMKRVAEEGQLLTTTSDDCSGNVCLAKYFCDGQWYRALTHPVQSQQHVSVFFVDYGDKQISEKTDVIPIPKTVVDLLMTPMQALRCSLLNLPEGEHLPEVNKWLETHILNKSFQAKFMSRDNNGHFVCDLYDGNVHINEKVRELMATCSVAERNLAVSKPALDSHREEADVRILNSKVNTKQRGCGKTNSGHKQSSKPIKPPKTQYEPAIKEKPQDTTCSLKVVPSHKNMPKLCDLPAAKMKPGSSGVGFISHCSSVKSFFIQMEDDETNILQMDEELNSTVFKDNMENVATVVEVGDLVAAEYEEDLALYRAVVTNVSNCGRLAVEFIDYGNPATVDRKNVHMLTNHLLSQPRLSTLCTLAKPYSFENDDSFIKEAVGKPLMVEFIRKLENSWEVSIKIEDGQTHGNSKYDGDQSKDVVMPSQEILPEVSQSENQTDSQTHKSNHKSVKTVQTELCTQQRECELKKTHSRTYQQKTKSNTQRKCEFRNTQRKCEFRNNQTFSKKPIKKAGFNFLTYVFWNRKYKRRQNNLKPKDVVLAKLPCDTSISATKTSRKLQENVSTFNADDHETSKSTDSVALQDVEDIEAVESTDDPPPFPDTSSKISLDRPPTLLQAPVQMNFGYKGFAAAVTTPSEFYIFLEDLLLIAETVSAILENLPEVLVPLPEVDLVPGASCLVKSAGKKKWCRAEIVQCNPTSVLINLVDYGQYSVVSQHDVCQLKRLPEELGRLPKVTYHCLLGGVKPNGPDWSDDAIVFFQNCMCQGNLQIRFRQPVSETQWEVDIISGKQNLAKELVDADHAMYIDHMLGIRFEQEQGANRESKQQDISTTVDVLSMMTEHTCKFDQMSSQDVVEQDTSHPLNSSGDHLGPVERAMLSPTSGELM
ncbi:tudor domain-containing protein 15 isoform X2 [Pimephales promelas]|uniref:tudor domain-containing protein 15 isoform X2 n=1 Tax=Pimephales promelas TaxID=90988 RepID=UPI0019557798|nr:tudor domain-containing protein 15 isoform X2 [Pimephales promelas]KAG1963414.1 tudor domain-containing protein [Pimephales promelas]